MDTPQYSLLDIKAILKGFSERPISYYKVYSEVTGSLTTGVLFSQLMYWWGAMDGEEFYKTEEELKDEIYLSRHEFIKAKDTLKKLNLINVTVRGVPAKSYYTINVEVLIDLITSWLKNGQLVGRKSGNLLAENQPTIYKVTENKTETTSEITPELRSGEESETTNNNFSDKGITKNFSAIGKKKFSSVEIKGDPAVRKLTGSENIEVFKHFQQLIFPICNELTPTIVEGVPRAIKFFEKYYSEGAVEKLKQTISDMAADSYFQKNPYVKTPKIFFSAAFIENSLLPLSHNQNQDGAVPNRPYTDEELRQAEEDNKKRIEAFMAHHRK